MESIKALIVKLLFRRSFESFSVGLNSVELFHKLYNMVDMKFFKKLTQFTGGRSNFLLL